MRAGLLGIENAAKNQPSENCKQEEWRGGNMSTRTSRRPSSIWNRGGRHVTVRGFYSPSSTLRLTPTRQVVARHGVVTTPARGWLRSQYTTNFRDCAVIRSGLATMPFLFPSAATMGIPIPELLSSQHSVPVVEDSVEGSVTGTIAE